MLIRPVVDGAVIVADRVCPIRDNGAPARFVPGWNPIDVYTGLGPVQILRFRHDDGTEAVWYLDAEYNRRGGSIADMQAEAKRALTAATCTLFDGLWAKIMQHAVPPPLDAREAGFFTLPEICRREMLTLFLDSFDNATRYGTPMDPNPDRPGSRIVDLGSRRLDLPRAHVDALLDVGLLQVQNLAFARDGHMSFPSPVDGSPMRVQHAILLSDVIYAYRAVEETTGTVLFLIGNGIFFHVSAVFVPDARLVISPNPNAMQTQMPNLFREFFARIMQSGDRIARYFAMDRVRPLHTWRGLTAMHLGHVLWNDISGIGSMVEALPQELLPRLAVFESGLEPEMYGPLDSIFPELDGLVERHPEALMQALPYFYEQGFCPIRMSAMRVNADIRNRVMASVNPMDRKSPASVCRKAKRQKMPVIVLGLRVENRTIVELEKFCRTLVAHLSRTLGRAVLVVDGHNSRAGERDAFILSHGERSAQDSPIAFERTLVASMQAEAQDTGLEVISTIGLPVSESLACGREASAMIAIWGAGLAKYRWICNIPGLVITNRWNLTNLGDLTLYASPQMMESPTPISYIPAEAVQDDPEAALMVRLGDGFIPSICNFHIDERLAMDAIDAVLRTTLPILA